MAQGLDDWLADMDAAMKGGMRLLVQRGHKFGYTFTYPLDLTGATLRGQVREYPDAPGDPLAEFACANLGFAAGVTTFTFSLTAEETAALPAAPQFAAHIDFPFDLLCTPDGGEEETLLAGAFRLTGRITQP